MDGTHHLDSKRERKFQYFTKQMDWVTFKSQNYRGASDEGGAVWMSHDQPLTHSQVKGNIFILSYTQKTNHSFFRVA